MTPAERKGAEGSRLPPAQGSEEELAAYHLPDGQPLALFHVLAHSPAALGDLRSATARAIRATSLNARLRELLILRVLDRCRAESEIAVHLALFGQEAGLDGESLRALRDDDLHLEPLERDIVSLADAVSTRGGEIDDVLWDRLLASLGSSGLVDALFVATQYVKVALLVRALRIPIPEEKP